MAGPDIERGGIGIAQKDDMKGIEAELSGGGEGFVPANGVQAPDGAGNAQRRPAGEEGGEFVVRAQGEKAYLDGQIEKECLLDEAAGGEGFVVGMRGQNQQAVAIAQQKGFNGAPGGERKDDRNGGGHVHQKPAEREGGRHGRERPHAGRAGSMRRGWMPDYHAATLRQLAKQEKKNEIPVGGVRRPEKR